MRLHHLFRTMVHHMPAHHDERADPAVSAFIALQRWYDWNNGLWESMWWNSANCLTTVALLGAQEGLDASVRAEITQRVLPNTMGRICNGRFGTSLVKEVREEDGTVVAVAQEMQLTLIPRRGDQKKGRVAEAFLNDFYDDEAWWVLGWIAAYDATGDGRYLALAQGIFADIELAYNTTPCGGGIWWNKGRSYVSSISNSLFLQAAAQLAVRTCRRALTSPYSISGSHTADADYRQCRHYRSLARSQWAWIRERGLINSQGLVNDGLNSSCANNGEMVWTYNNGAMIAGLANLAELLALTDDDGDHDGDPDDAVSLLRTARRVADATIGSMTDNDGILHEPNEDKLPDRCGRDGSQFKGVFPRGLQELVRVQRVLGIEEGVERGENVAGRYIEFLRRNAESIWTRNRERGSDRLGLIWSGPVVDPNASAHSSAMDALVAARAVSY